MAHHASDNVEASAAKSVMRGMAILWVDDNPRNNSYYVQQLQDMEFSVDLSLSTSDAIKRFEQNDYDLIISDMGRRENDAYNYTAGMDFLKSVRENSPSIPFVIFTTSKAVKQYSSEATQNGAMLITSSWTKIMSILLKRFMGTNK